MDYDPEEGMALEQVFAIFGEEGLKPRYDGKQTVEGRPLEQIYIAITNPELEFNQVWYWINQTTKFPEKIVLINRMQTKTTYAFSNQRIDLPSDTIRLDSITRRWSRSFSG